MSSDKCMTVLGSDSILTLAVQSIHEFLLVRSLWLRVFVMRDLAQPIAPLKLSASRAVGRGGALRCLRMGAALRCRVG